MPEYTWRNLATGEVTSVYRSVSFRNIPPPGTGWVRLYAAPAIGKVEGAGDSPSRKSGDKHE